MANGDILTSIQVSLWHHFIKIIFLSFIKVDSSQIIFCCRFYQLNWTQKKNINNSYFLNLFFSGDITASITSSIPLLSPQVYNSAPLIELGKPLELLGHSLDPSFTSSTVFDEIQNLWKKKRKIIHRPIKYYNSSPNSNINFNLLTLEFLYKPI